MSNLESFLAIVLVRTKKCWRLFWGCYEQRSKSNAKTTKIITLTNQKYVFEIIIKHNIGQEKDNSINIFLCLFRER